MLRDELFHPAVVHFPIAFLALSGALALFWFVFRGRGQTTLMLVLLLGVIGGWLAILTGGWAEDVVNRVICDPTVTHDHESWAEWSVWSATAALPIVALVRFARHRLSLVLRTAAAAMLAFSSGAVLYAGHLGATLVYQQGAAVYKPAPQCTEFE